MNSRLSRLKCALSEAQLLFDAIQQEKVAGKLNNSSKQGELLKCARRVGFLLSTIKEEGWSAATTKHLSCSVDTSVKAAEDFLGRLLDSHMLGQVVPTSCVGLIACVQSPKEPFSTTVPFVLHKDPRDVCVKAKIFECQVNPTPARPACASSSAGACNSDAATHTNGAHLAAHCYDDKTARHSVPEEAAQQQVLDDITNFIRDMKGGALLMSDMIQQEKQQLEVNAALLQRGVDRTTAQSKNISKAGAAFGCSSSQPRFLNRLPGATVIWNSMLIPLWSAIKQAFFMFVIVAITGGMLMFMLVVPKTYVYAQ
ncbi:hypothetical protein ERJ75_001046500 [Trypanosoma vivax]|uniref:Uncharacterized protein n=1 Tax=Trypanosoma vivax (strain Y486) TaxID=1055687 RepID=F9WPG0_TRYVY|nr:hypothetical protein TRVL_01656 [Trypanosoma vivax]KAH8610764.1 hypothetical protein ERJ75_001046500 [Trypanosoma vivax]CCD19437.1 hypothetical protein, conserved [Trypanosoma vivax Y486]|eukprot:CCD19437.1 hypothetical protein, conserved [Trypanosoma vivax Y486]